MYATAEAVVRRLAWITALAGGLALAFITVMTVVSISGRALIKLGLGPVPGDFELVEAFVGFAVFAFLPWCHYRRGHASVEILTNAFPDRVNGVIEIVANLLMAVAAVIIFRQQWLGLMDKVSNGETTFILAFPIWWAYAAAQAGAGVFVIVSLFCIWRAIREFATGAVPAASGAVH